MVRWTTSETMGTGTETYITLVKKQRMFYDLSTLFIIYCTQINILYEVAISLYTEINL